MKRKLSIVFVTALCLLFTGCLSFEGKISDVTSDIGPGEKIIIIRSDESLGRIITDPNYFEIIEKGREKHNLNKICTAFVQSGQILIGESYVVFRVPEVEIFSCYLMIVYGSFLDPYFNLYKIDESKLIFQDNIAYISCLDNGRVSFEPFPLEVLDQYEEYAGYDDEKIQPWFVLPEEFTSNQ